MYNFQVHSFNKCICLCNQHSNQDYFHHSMKSPWTHCTPALPQETTVLIFFSPRLLFLVAQMVKHLPAMQKTWSWSLGWEEPLLEKGMQPIYSVFLDWRFQGQRSLAGYSPWRPKRVGHNWVNTTHTYSRYPLVSLFFCSARLRSMHDVAQSEVHLFFIVSSVSWYGYIICLFVCFPGWGYYEQSCHVYSSTSYSVGVFFIYFW